MATAPERCFKSTDVAKHETKLTAYSLFKQFTQSTTLHGIRNVFGNYCKIRRFLWLLCLLGCCAFLVGNLIRLLSSYYDVVTHIALVTPKYAVFPAVTICNFNIVRKDFDQATNISKLVSIEAMFFNHTWGLDKEEEVSQKVLNMTVDELYKNASHKKEETIYSCQFSNEPCSYQNFTPIATKMGVCYQFNAGAFYI